MDKIFIDGQAGTTGLQILERLKNRQDIDLLEIPSDKRKEPKAKQEYLNAADIVVLCLPDEAAIESVAMVNNPKVKILDASNAHRTNKNWVYGLPEMEPSQREKIKNARYVSNPGCYPTGFLLAVIPLLKSGIIAPDYPVTINAVSGYSGGGRQLIERYQSMEDTPRNGTWSYRLYGMQMTHKHLAEMHEYSGLLHPPMFIPAVANVNQGMLVSIPLLIRMLKNGATAENVHSALSEYYEHEIFIKVPALNRFEELSRGFLSPVDCNGTNRLDLLIFGNKEHALLLARLDNLGKGASGAAVQNLNIMLGKEESLGLSVS